jgi:hypothetical protein
MEHRRSTSTAKLVQYTHPCGVLLGDTAIVSEQFLGRCAHVSRCFNNVMYASLLVYARRPSIAQCMHVSKLAVVCKSFTFACCVGWERQGGRGKVGSSSQANCLMRNTAMDDSIGGS